MRNRGFRLNPNSFNKCKDYTGKMPKQQELVLTILSAEILPRAQACLAQVMLQVILVQTEVIR